MYCFDYFISKNCKQTKYTCVMYHDVQLDYEYMWYLDKQIMNIAE